MRQQACLTACWKERKIRYIQDRAASQYRPTGVTVSETAQGCHLILVPSHLLLGLNGSGRAWTLGREQKRRIKKHGLWPISHGHQCPTSSKCHLQFVHGQDGHFCCVCCYLRLFQHIVVWVPAAKGTSQRWAPPAHHNTYDICMEGNVTSDTVFDQLAPT